VLANAPEFKPLDVKERRTVIVYVLNLKGGVGKTTITANLGATLDGPGYRTLTLDLDLQGSLTGLFLSVSVQEPLWGHPAKGLGRQPDLGRGAGAGGADVGVADVLAAGTFGPRLPQPMPSRPTSGPDLAPVTHCANFRNAKGRLGHRLPAVSTR